MGNHSISQGHDRGNLRIVDEACSVTSTDPSILTNAAPPPELPRLLYVGDVPVEASYHGSALLYRLLQRYPANRLAIVEAGIETSKPERRVSNADYLARRLSLSRLQTTRFSHWYTTVCLRTAVMRAGCLVSLARARRPDAILTVVHGYSWITAAELARRLDVPLHLICHDEWTRTGTMRAWRDRVFNQYFRTAASRLCVSPFMAREYELLYGVETRVLYPCRAPDAVHYAEPPARLSVSIQPFTCVFAGTINSPGIILALRQLAKCLESFGGQLLIYGPLTAEVARASGLAGKNIKFGGLFSSTCLMETLRKSADALFVPMSFAAPERKKMEISFPSKLVDYTATGLPLLIYGPPYCSAVQWAAGTEGVAEVVTEEGEEHLAAAISRLAKNPQHRMTLARTALAANETYFSYLSASKVFYKALAPGVHIPT